MDNGDSGLAAPCCARGSGNNLEDGGNPPMEMQWNAAMEDELRDDPEGNNLKRGKRATMGQWKWRVITVSCCLEAGAQHTNQ